MQSTPQYQRLWWVGAGILATLALLEFLLPPSLPGCSDSDMEELAVELVLEHHLLPQMGGYSEETVDFWLEEGGQYLEFVTTQEDFSSDNMNFCTAEFYSKRIMLGTDPVELTDEPTHLAEVAYTVTLSDEDDIFVTIEHFAI